MGQKREVLVRVVALSGDLTVGRKSPLWGEAASGSQGNAISVQPIIIAHPTGRTRLPIRICPGNREKMAQK
jgi:hypothetical protein